MYTARQARRSRALFIPTGRKKNKKRRVKSALRNRRASNLSFHRREVDTSRATCPVFTYGRGYNAGIYRVMRKCHFSNRLLIVDLRWRETTLQRFARRCSDVSLSSLLFRDNLRISRRKKTAKRSQRRKSRHVWHRTLFNRNEPNEIRRREIIY